MEIRAPTHDSESSSQRWPGVCKALCALLDTLRELGDSGRPKEVSENIAARLNLPDEFLNRTLKNGSSRFVNQVAWARFYLAKAGLIDTSRRGVWTLTELGRRSQLDHEKALGIFRDVQKTFKEDEAPVAILPGSEEAGAPPDERAPGEETFREEMAKVLQSLSSGGFERLCQRICAK